MSERCSRCCACCGGFPYVVVSDAEIAALAAFTGLAPDEFTYPKGDPPESHFLQFRANGDCIFLDSRGGGLGCTVYSARGQVCRDYPGNYHQLNACDGHRDRGLKA